MNMALETLFHPFQSGALEPRAPALFLNAQNYPALSAFSDMTLQQSFKPYADGLQGAGYSSVPEIPYAPHSFDVVLIAAPKNQIETLYLIANALRVLKQGGLLIVAADNKAGGSRLVKNLEHFGLQNIQSESRNKARAVWAYSESFDDSAVQEVLAAGEMQAVLNGQFQSQPGIYGWDKIDQGSQILLENLPKDLKGKGADFGCGYGFLAKHIVQNDAIKSLICIDADARAIEACRRNVERAEFHWADLTKKAYPNAFDFIVMNPPFHEGKKADIAIGKKFIVTAAQSLKRKGTLYMVANKHLPYEKILQDQFFKVEKLFEEQGFKVFKAEK